MTTQYLFIDAGYLDQVLADVSREWFGGAPMTPDYKGIGRNYRKIFYYDCLPPRREHESDAEYKERSAPKEQHFERLRSLDGWHVSEGIAKHRRRTGATQKEVDILIAVDILSHTHRRNMTLCSFLAGDQDFCPLIEQVVREGMYVQLWYHPSSISRDLKNAADSANVLDLYTLYGYMDGAFQSKHPLPHIFRNPNAGMRGANPTFCAKKDGAVIAMLFQHPEAGWWEIIGTAHDVNVTYEHMTFADLDFLKRVFEHLRGPVEWAAA
ncbi:NYN domain-containing protein [Variovorax sp. LjRoot175]|uniref:NYN domain-containing protein n=1 Tax=Variovorax sp. LjRoot175 TaxID=3342276 RepID=UPI003ECCACC9